MMKKNAKALIVTEYVANAPPELTNRDKVLHRVVQSQQYDELGGCALHGKQIRPYPIESSSTRRKFARGVMIIRIAIKRDLKKIDLVIQTLRETIVIEEVAVRGHT